MRLRIIVKYVLLILWMMLIFWFSNQKGINSSDMSNTIVEKIVDIIENITNLNIEQSISNITLIVRKIAHFLVYFVLGILWMLLLKEYNILLNKQIIYTLLFCLIYSCSDEIHQLFIDGRNGNLLDVVIDMFGSLSSIFIVLLFDKKTT